MSEQYGLIADIGGTNARFALAPIRTERPLQLAESDLIQIHTLNGADYETIADAIEAYFKIISAANCVRPTRATLAIACPTDKDWVQMTNHTWAFSVAELKAQLGLESLVFINDYHALANSIPFLGDQGAVKVGGGEPKAGAPMVVTGPGTGLGLAALVFHDGEPVTVQTEGGHSHFAATTPDEIAVVEYLLTKHSRISNERLLSGMGLENLYEANHFIATRELQRLPAPDVSKAAVEGSDPIAEKSLNMMCEVLGSFAGDAALMFGAKGGVFIAGGIVPRFMDFFKESGFRMRFEQKARFANYNAEIPTYVVVSKQPGLLGAAAVLNYTH